MLVRKIILAINLFLLISSCSNKSDSSQDCPTDEFHIELKGNVLLNKTRSIITVQLVGEDIYVDSVITSLEYLDKKIKRSIDKMYDRERDSSYLLLNLSHEKNYNASKYQTMIKSIESLCRDFFEKQALNLYGKSYCDLSIEEAENLFKDFYITIYEMDRIMKEFDKLEKYIK